MFNVFPGVSRYDMENIKTNLDPKQLKYSIHCCSSFSASYQPENILHDKPQDQSSRFVRIFLNLF